MKRKFLFSPIAPCVFLTVVFLFSVIQAAEAAPWRLYIIQSASHQALDDVANGVKKYFHDEKIDVDFRVTVGVVSSDAETERRKVLQEITDYDPHLILPIGTQAAQFVAEYLETTPAVFSAVTDPVGSGLVKSLETPGPFMTGLTDMSPVTAQLDMIRMIHPDMTTLGIVFSAFEQNALMIRDHLKAACDKEGVALIEAPVRRDESVAVAAMRIVEAVEALYIPTDNHIVSRIDDLVQIYYPRRVPLYAADPSSVGGGAVAALSIDYSRMGFQAGAMSLRVLNGTNPADIPVAKSREMVITVNVKAAEAIELSLPMDLLLAADKLHETIPIDRP